MIEYALHIQRNAECKQRSEERRDGGKCKRVLPLRCSLAHPERHERAVKTSEFKPRNIPIIGVSQRIALAPRLRAIPIRPAAVI